MKLNSRKVCNTPRNVCEWEVVQWNFNKIQKVEMFFRPNRRHIQLKEKRKTFRLRKEKSSMNSSQCL